MCISSKSLDNADTTIHFDHSCSYWICQSHHKTHVLGNIQRPGLSEAQHRDSSLCEKNHWGKSQILVFTLSGGRPQWLFNLVVLKVWFPNQNYQHHLGARYESRISGPTQTDWLWHSAGGVQQSVYFCYWVQAHSAHHMTDQWIWEMRCWGKEYNFIWKTGRPRTMQTNVAEKPSCWGLDARFFYRVRERERRNEELNSKGRIERERQWESKVKGSSVLLNICL